MFGKDVFCTYANPGTTGRFSGLRRGLVFLLVLAMMLALFGTVFSVRADAARYRVKAWVSDDGTSCYYVYQGSLPRYYEPTFCRYGTDVYKSGNSSVSFYWPVDYTDNAIAEALVDHHLNNAKKVTTVGWYSCQMDDYEYIYYVYKIIGWGYSSDSLDKLLRKSPFTNSNGEKLYIEYIGSGNYTGYSSVRNECSEVFYWSDFNATIGFRFVDEYGYTTYKYCV